MTAFKLPLDGSVIVVDDKTSEALPLIELLSSKGVSSVYYSGQDEKLPPAPLNKVRVAFFDIQLFGPSNANNYAANILRLLDRLIKEDNGPYVLVLWTTIEDSDASDVVTQLNAQLGIKKPVAILRLEKASYFAPNSDSSARDNLIAEVNDVLGSRFDDADLEAITRLISDELQPTDMKVPVDNALELISQELNTKLQEQADSFQLFTHWENLICQASGKTAHIFSSLHDNDEYWPQNFKSSVFRMAQAQLGKNTSSLSNDDIIKNAMKTMNGTFMDVVENHYPTEQGIAEKIGFKKDEISFSCKINDSEFKITKSNAENSYFVFVNNAPRPNANAQIPYDKIISKGADQSEKDGLLVLSSKYQSIKPSINTKLLIDSSTPNYVQPGNVYEKTVSDDRKKILLKTYFKGNGTIWEQNGNFKTDVDINEFKFIELEISPICDFAQDKWLRYRFLPGLMVPEKFIKQNDVQDGDSFYGRDIPIVTFGGINYRLVFDFRLLKSVDRSEQNLPPPIYRFRAELSSAILSRLSSHASRMGITLLE